MGGAPVLNLLTLIPDLLKVLYECSNIKKLGLIFPYYLLHYSNLFNPDFLFYTNKLSTKIVFFWNIITKKSFA